MSAGRNLGPVRAVVIGAGLMGWWHAAAIVRAGGCLSAVVDADGQRARLLAARYPGTHAAAELGELPHNRDRVVEVVHVCTPPETHEALARNALLSGKHVLVEKPLAPSTAATDDLLRLADERGVLLCPVHQLVFQQGVLDAQHALGTVGPLLHADTVACSAGAAGRTDDERDRLVADILPHPLSLFARMLPDCLASVKWQVQHPAAGELRAIGRAGGVSLSVLVSTRGRPTRHTLRLIGERGTVYVDLFHGFCVVDRGPVTRAHKIAHPFILSGGILGSAATNLAWRAMRREVAYPGLQELVKRFHGAIRGSERPMSTAEIRNEAAAREALVRMLLEGRPAW